MGRFYTIDRANERLPEVRVILERLRAQRRELIALRDELVARRSQAEATTPLQSGRRPPPSDPAEEREAIRLRMRGIIDQMEAAVQQLIDWDITLRDIETGLIDFPALANGRQIWLCWRLGEEEIAWWHELEAGFAGRRPLVDLV